MTFKVKTKGQIEGEKLLVPKLRFKEFKDEWKEISLVNVFTFYNTNSLSRADLSEEGLIKNIHYGDIHQKFNNILDVNKEKLPYIKSDIKVKIHNEENYCQDGDLILADASEDYDGIGKAVEVINVGNNKIVSGLHTILARDTNKVMSLGFKGYLFNTSLIHNQIRVLANGFKVYGISKNNIYDLDVRIPTKTEQEKITNFLILLDKKIELQQRKIEALKIYKKGLIQKLKYRSQNWNEYKIKNLFEITRGQVIPKNSLKVTPDEEYKYPVYSSQTSNYGILGYDKTYDFDGKFLTWTTDGANAGKVFYRNGKFRCTNVCGLLYSPTDSPYINLLTADLLNYETPKHVSYVGNPKLMNNVMADIKIKLPSIEIQNKISNIFSVLNNKLLIEENKLKNLNTMKKSLLQQMFI